METEISFVSFLSEMSRDFNEAIREDYWDFGDMILDWNYMEIDPIISDFAFMYCSR